MSDDLVAVQASLNSVFYAQPNPGEPTFVKEGDQVEEDTVVCLLEIMKCFRSVPSGVKVTVEKVDATNAAMVKKGEALIYIRPEA
mgnify:FL=1